LWFFLLDQIRNFDKLLLFSMTIEIKLRKGEPIDRAIRRLKKRLDREGVIRDVRAKRYFEKPSDKKRIARKVAAFTQMLRTRYEKM
jgi:small subunit ribosomal protein S21